MTAITEVNNPYASTMISNGDNPTRSSIDTNYHFCYETICLVNDNRYIGVHTTEVHPSQDDYLGSGKGVKYSILEHGPANHVRKEIAFFDTREDAEAFEKTHISLIQSLIGESCLNMKVGRKRAKNGEKRDFRLTFLMNADEYKTFCTRRKKGTVEEISESQFLRDWLRFTQMFDESTKDQSVSTQFGNLARLFNDEEEEKESTKSKLDDETKELLNSLLVKLS